MSQSEYAPLAYTRSTLALSVILALQVPGCGDDGNTATGPTPDSGPEAAATADAASTDAPSNVDHEAGGPACGVTLYEDTTCQSWLDGNCCAYERACDATCASIIACMNACPAPKSDACITNCLPAGDNAPLNEIADCSKRVVPPAGISCSWPK